MSSGSSNSGAPGDEIDLSGLLLILWGYRRWIFVCTSAITLIGVVNAFLAAPIFYSQAIIALKETGRGNEASRIFSQLGGMGGMVAAQLGMGNTSLDKLDIILRGHELADSVISKNDLMPVLFPKLWDDKKKAWKPKGKRRPPTIMQGANKLRKAVLVVDTDKKRNLIKVGANIGDPTLAKTIVDLYLVELNGKIRSDVRGDAENNRLYLESQLNNTRDPVLMEKVQNMIAFEIEKYMLVSNQAFEILEKPVVPMVKTRPRKKLIVVVSFFLGLFVSVAGAFFWMSIESLRAKLRGAGLDRA